MDNVTVRMSPMIQLEMVLLRAFGGAALRRWLVAENEAVAYVTNNDGRTAIERGREPEFVVGFPKGDVFQPDPAVADGSHPDWSKLTPRRNDAA